MAAICLSISSASGAAEAAGVKEHFALEGAAESSRQVHVDYGLDMQQAAPLITTAPSARLGKQRPVTPEKKGRANKKSPPTGPEQVILHVTLNTADTGEYFMEKTFDGDLLLKQDVLKKMGLQTIPGRKPAAGVGLLSLRAMSPKITYKLDDQSGELAITADPALLPKQTLDLNTRQPSGAEFIQDSSAFINYALNYNASRGSKGQLNAPFELGLNLAGVFASSNFTYQQGQQPRRIQTQLVYENPDLLQRWEAGDIQAQSGDGGATLGGIRLSSNFGIKPELLTLPSLSLQAMLATPSDVELFINGISVSKESLPAGPLTITNPPFYDGLGDAVLVVRDAFGREKRYKYSFYSSASLLAPGLHDYSLAIGLPQQRANDGKIQYGGHTTFMGVDRYGFSDWLTASLGGELDGANVGLNIHALLVSDVLGLLDISVAGSHRAGVNGFSGNASFSWQGSDIISTSLFFRGQSLHFGSILADSTQVQKQRWSGGFNLGVVLGEMGSLSANISLSENFDHSRSKHASLLFSTNILGKLGLNMQAARRWDENRTISDTLNLNMNYTFDNGLSLSGNVSQDNGVSRFGVQLQKSLPFGDGFAYRADSSGSMHGKPTSTQEIQYQNSYGEYALSRSGGASNDSYAARLNSALLLTAGRMHVSRPIRNGFALVRTGDMPNVKVQYNNQLFGVTDSHGELVVPEMIAYTDNHIDIDASDIPMGYNIDSSSRNVTSSFRGGGVVEFKITKLQALEGKAFYLIDGKKKPAQYSGLELDSGNKKTQAIIGYGGVFYMEHIQAGNYHARFFNETRNCHFELTVPESEKMILNLGDVVCKVDSAEQKE